jgi:hypothetical protein
MNRFESWYSLTYPWVAIECKDVRKNQKEKKMKKKILLSYTAVWNESWEKLSVDRRNLSERMGLVWFR